MMNITFELNINFDLNITNSFECLRNHVKDEGRAVEGTFIDPTTETTHRDGE